MVQLRTNDWRPISILDSPQMPVIIKPTQLDASENVQPDWAIDPSPCAGRTTSPVEGNLCNFLSRTGRWRHPGVGPRFLECCLSG